MPPKRDPEGKRDSAPDLESNTAPDAVDAGREAPQPGPDAVDPPARNGGDRQAAID